MDTSTLRPIYAIGIALNVIALAYALSEGSYLFASAFGFVIVYLAFRYRMLRS